MSGYTSEDAQAFIEAMRLTVAGKTGFTWMTTRLEDLAGHVRGLAGDNEAMRAFLQARGLLGEFEEMRGGTTDDE